METLELIIAPLRDGLYTIMMPVSNFIWSYILVYLLLGAGLLFTIMTKGMQFRLFRHMAHVTFTARGAGDGISGFQAFATSMAARVGTGNLAGVALALWIGGPGAIFWMWVIAILGMATGFAESILGQIYKIRDSNGDFINVEELDSQLNVLYSNYSSGENSIIRRYAGLPDGPITFTDMTDDLFDASPTAMKASPRTSELLVGTENGKVLKVSGTMPFLVWSDISNAGFLGSVSDIEFGETDNDIFVTFHNYGVQNVWYSNDGGTSWLAKEGDFPDIPVKAILQNPLNSKEVIIGTDLGVWKTKDFSVDSPEWTQSYNGMNSVKVTDLDLRDDNMVFAATYGRGVFSGQFTGATASVEDVLSGNNAFTMYPTVSKGDFTLQAKSSLGLTKMSVFSISGKQVYTKEIDFTLNGKQQVSLNLNTGLYIVNVIDENNKKSSLKIVIE